MRRRSRATTVLLAVLGLLLGASGAAAVTTAAASTPSAATAAAPGPAAPGVAPGSGPAAAGVAPAAAGSAARAAASAARLVLGRPSLLHPSPDDTYRQLPVISGTNGLQYVPYVRAYRGLPVVGGDFVVVTDAGGTVLSTSVGQQSAISLSPPGALDTPRARAVAEQRAVAEASSVPGAARVEGTRLVVLALSAHPRLAYESIVIAGRGAVPIRLRVYVDASSGTVLGSVDEVSSGTGTAAVNGPSPLPVRTSASGTSFAMRDPTRSGVSCRRNSTGAVLTGADDRWGNGDGTAIETGCVDALFAVDREWQMLSAWLGRQGIDGSGGGFPLYLGLNQPDAYWDGARVVVGRNTSGALLSSMDVVAHELGHAIDSTTPGGQSADGVSEATGDIFGALTEAYADETSAYDPPDYTVGEEVDRVGDGPIRYMYQPSLAGHPNCYSASVPQMETHAAAGPLNHWFYLVAEGSRPTDGNPSSPTCDGSTVGGALGIQTAGRIFYNAMLSKTTAMTYLRYRTATLAAAKNMFPGSCTAFTTVKAAWDAVRVPAQAADPTCSTGSGPVVVNPGPQASYRGAAALLQLSASGGTKPYTWSANGLPPGLAVDHTSGLVSGVPTTTGTYAVVVTATGGESGTASFSWTVAPSPGCPSPGQVLVNPGFESVTKGWTTSAGVVVLQTATAPAHRGEHLARLTADASRTGTLSQGVDIPAGCTATLVFFTRIDTEETTQMWSYDTLTVTAGSTPLATYSNLDKSSTYLRRSVDLTGYAGRRVTLTFTSAGDSSSPTTFLLDDVSVTTG